MLRVKKTIIIDKLDIRAFLCSVVFFWFIHTHLLTKSTWYDKLWITKGRKIKQLKIK